jgi:putative endonuclease
MKAFDLINLPDTAGMNRTAGQWKRTVRGIFWRYVLRSPLMKLVDSSNASDSLGNRGELAAERYLLKRGYIILFRGYEDKFGEIDLIAVDLDTIVFVEVKTRSTDDAGDPAEAVDTAKQSHLTKTGIGFLKWHRLTQYAARFDVVAILGDPLSASAEIRHYVNAFEPTGKFQMFG